MDHVDCPMTEQDRQILLDRYTDGMFNSQSRYAAAAHAFKRALADAVWDAVHAQQVAA